MATRSALINVMAGAAVRTARGLNRDFGEVANLQASEKGADAFAAASIKRAREVLMRELSKARRGYGYSEVGFPRRDGDPEVQADWLVSPLDGPDNFLHGVPGFATVIGARERGVVTAAVVYDPLRDELFWAERGTGCYINHQRARVSVRSRLETALVAIESDRDASTAAAYIALHSVYGTRVGAIRKLGSPALGLAYVSTGRLDAMLSIEMPGQIAEVGALLVQESGGMLGSLTSESNGVSVSADLVSNSRLDSALRKCFRQPQHDSPAA